MQEVREALRRSQVELPSSERPPRELARRSRAKAGEARECSTHSSLNCTAAVDVQLAHILTSGRRWSREPDSHATVKRGMSRRFNDFAGNEFTWTHKKA